MQQGLMVILCPVLIWGLKLHLNLLGSAAIASLLHNKKKIRAPVKPPTLYRSVVYFDLVFLLCNCPVISAFALIFVNVFPMKAKLQRLIKQTHHRRYKHKEMSPSYKNIQLLCTSTHLFGSQTLPAQSFSQTFFWLATCKIKTWVKRVGYAWRRFSMNT